MRITRFTVVHSITDNTAYQCSGVCLMKRLRNLFQDRSEFQKEFHPTASFKLHGLAGEIGNCASPIEQARESALMELLLDPAIDEILEVEFELLFSCLNSCKLNL